MTNAADPPRGRVLRHAADVDFALEDLPRTARPDRALMVDPGAFDLVHALNPHQLEADGSLKTVDRDRARAQWEALRAVYEDLGLTVDVLPAAEGLEDMVFCANQVLPVPGETPRLVPSHMASDSRAPEVPHVVRFLTELGYAACPLPDGIQPMEGMGDGLWHPGHRLLWAGVGPRSSEQAWVAIAEQLEVPVALLPLRDRDFYHLDTCFAWLDASTCLWRPDAFDDDARGLIEALVPRRIESDEDDARLRLANNAFCPDGRHVVIQRGCDVTNGRLVEAGFTPVEVETGEFLKSGGSVFCMKLFHGPI